MARITETITTLVLLTLLTACAASRVGPAADKRFAYVTNEKDSTLTVVDLETENVIRTLATGKTPHALVFTPAGKGYVNNRGEHSLTVIDGNEFTVLKSIALPATSMQFALSPDGNTLAVGYKDALKITFVDTTSDTILATVDIGRDRPGKKPVRIKHPFWSRDGRYVYAGDNLNRTVVKIDAANHEVAAIIPLRATVHHFIADPTGRYIYVCQGKNDGGGLGVTVLDAASDRVVRTIPVPLADREKAFGHHGAFSPDGKFFYFCNEGGRTVAIIDTAAMTVVKTLRVGRGAGHPYFSPDGGKVFVVCHHDNVVSVIDTRAQQVIKTVAVGRGMKEGHSGWFGPDGSFFMLNAADGTINRIDGKTLAPRSRIKVGNKPMIMVVR